MASKVEFALLTPATAPAESKPIMEAVNKAFGQEFNFVRGMAASPAAMKSLTAMSGNFESTKLDPQEQEVVFMGISQFNGCSY